MLMFIVLRSSSYYFEQILALPAEMIQKISVEAAILNTLDARELRTYYLDVYRSLATVCLQWKEILRRPDFQKEFLAQLLCVFDNDLK